MMLAIDDCSYGCWRFQVMFFQKWILSTPWGALCSEEVISGKKVKMKRKGKGTKSSVRYVLQEH